VAHDPPTAEGLLGPLEYEVLRALWADSPASVPAVLERLNGGRGHEQQLAYTTVMTVLTRLHEKGLLDRTRRGRGYEYRPRYTEPRLVEHLGRREVDDLVDRYGRVALAQFASALHDADPELLRQLHELGDADDA
jgi:predicted transcriptional regulator